MNLAAAVTLMVAASVALVRWLRVAQREHYLPVTVLRFVGRWWLLSPNPVLGLLGLAGGLASVVLQSVVGAFLVSVIGVLAPVRLGVRGRTSPLAWTPRLRRVAAVAAVPVLGGGLWSVLAESSGAAAVSVIGVPIWVVMSLAIMGPIERRMGERWVREAGEKLEHSEVRVVAITGSFGKTTTKNYVAHLLGSHGGVVISPASFNNRLGLARAINEHLGPDTDIFVAEMGTYGVGEIRDLCTWIAPDIAVITALGPVHLERMGSEERIAAAKAEILERAPVGVINIDHPILAALAASERSRRKIVTVSTRDPEAYVFVNDAKGEVSVSGDTIGVFRPQSALGSNVGCAVAVAVALGLDLGEIGSRLDDLPAVPHRRAVGQSEKGFWIIDDTFNANPAGAEAALALMSQIAEGRKVVVTPGMVELGRLQLSLNQSLGRRIGETASDLVIVGRTNRRALRAGAAEAGLHSVIVAGSRDQAVSWVRSRLGPGDVVLYENDLPDHYP